MRRETSGRAFLRNTKCLLSLLTLRGSSSTEYTSFSLQQEMLFRHSFQARPAFSKDLYTRYRSMSYDQSSGSFSKNYTSTRIRQRNWRFLRRLRTNDGASNEPQGPRKYRVQTSRRIKIQKFQQDRQFRGEGARTLVTFHCRFTSSP